MEIVCGFNYFQSWHVVRYLQLHNLYPTLSSYKNTSIYNARPTFKYYYINFRTRSAGNSVYMQPEMSAVVCVVLIYRQPHSTMPCAMQPELLTFIT